jgi:hypothetical protein
MSPRTTADNVFAHRLDRLAALSCFFLAALITAGSLAGVIDLLRGCTDPRHSCAYVITSQPVAIAIAALCVGLGYWMWPKLGKTGGAPTSEPPNGR